MDFVATEQIRLDYAGDTTGKVLGDVSGIALAPSGHLWTVSDEGRTVECLRPDGDGYRLANQIALDTLIAGLPHGNDELDLEAVAVDGTHLWVTGSHCWVRRKPPDSERDRLLLAGTRDRPSRHVLARLKLGPDPATIHHAHWLPLTGAGSLRDILAGDAYLAPFLELPSKENGLDIEGLALLGGELLLGLRGPVLDGRAVVLALSVTEEAGGFLRVISYRRFFLDLGGLGIRDLARLDGEILVLAGPVTDAAGPFQLVRWTPDAPDEIGATTPVCDFIATGEKPEGVCVLARNGVAGLAVVYDSPDRSRIRHWRYLADWAPLP